MAGQVILAHIGLHLADPAGQALSLQQAHQPASQQIARDLQGGAKKEILRQQGLGSVAGRPADRLVWPRCELHRWLLMG